MKKEVNNTWTETLREEASKKSSLKLLNTNECKIGSVHPIWRALNTPLAIQKATVKVKLAVQRYPIASSPTAGALHNNICPLCKKDEETIHHFVLTCPSLAKDRRPYLSAILAHHRDHRVSIDPDSLISTILDPTNCPKNAQMNQTTTNLLYKLHNTRSVLLGGGSCYRMAAGK